MLLMYVLLNCSGLGRCNKHYIEGSRKKSVVFSGVFKQTVHKTRSKRNTGKETERNVSDERTYGQIITKFYLIFKYLSRMLVRNKAFILIGW